MVALPLPCECLATDSPGRALSAEQPTELLTPAAPSSELGPKCSSCFSSQPVPHLRPGSDTLGRNTVHTRGRPSWASGFCFSSQLPLELWSPDPNCDSCLGTLREERTA